MASAIKISLKIDIPANDEPLAGLPEERNEYLWERLKTPDKKSPEEIMKRFEDDILRKPSLIQATVEKSSCHNKRARDVAARTKEEAATSAAHRAAALRARLDSASEWRRVHSEACPRTPTGPPRKAAPWKEPAAVPFTPTAALAGLKLAPTADEQHEPPTELAAEVEVRPLHEEIEAQLEAAKGELSALAEWMKHPATIGLVAEWLSTLGIDRALAKRLLALVYMAYESQSLFDASDADAIMSREADRFRSRLRAQLKRGTAQAAKEPFEASLMRARRFYAAWAAQDVTKQASAVDEALARLHEAVLRVRAQQAAEGVEPAPPEALLAQVKLLGGEGPEEAARRAFAQPWQAIAPTELEQRVREVATRAIWDAVAEQVGRGQYAGLFSLLGELQQAMAALIAHSPRHAEEFADRFDAKLIEQQAMAGCLTTADVHGLVAYIVERVSGWQAPVDDSEARSWAATIQAMLRETRETSLDVFIGSNLLGFLRTAFDRVGKVHQRVVETAARREQGRAQAP